MKNKKTRAKPTPIAPAGITGGSPEERTARRDAREALFAKALCIEDIDEREKSFLGVCQMLYRRESGCNTPFEEFFKNLVQHVQWGRWPDPDDVSRLSEEFAGSYDITLKATNKFIEAYPDVVDVSATEDISHAA